MNILRTSLAMTALLAQGCADYSLSDGEAYETNTGGGLDQDATLSLRIDVFPSENLASDRLEEGVARLNRRFGLDVPVPRANASRRRPGLEPAADCDPEWLRQHGVPGPRAFEDPETISLAESMYAEDLALWRQATDAVHAE